MEHFYQDMGIRIATLRKENHLTQMQLAEKLDVSVKHISSIERGISCPSIDKLVLLCDILSTDLDYMVRGIDHRGPSESQIPSYISEIFLSDNEKMKKWISDYLHIFKEITSEK